MSPGHKWVLWSQLIEWRPNKRLYSIQSSAYCLRYLPIILARSNKIYMNFIYTLNFGGALFVCALIPFALFTFITQFPFFSLFVYSVPFFRCFFCWYFWIFSERIKMLQNDILVPWAPLHIICESTLTHSKSSAILMIFYYDYFHFYFLPLPRIAALAPAFIFSVSLFIRILYFSFLAVYISGVLYSLI